jgi:hypothetical protein
VERVRCSNLVLDKIRETAIVLTHYFDSVRMDSLFGEAPSADGNPETDRTLEVQAGEGTPTFRDITFRGLMVGPVRDLAVIEGLAERFIERVTLEEISAPVVKSGIVCQRVRGLAISDVTVEASEGAAVAARRVEQLQIHRLRSLQPSSHAPLIQLDEVSGAFIHACSSLQRDAQFVRLHGTRNRNVVVTANWCATNRG